MRDNTKVPQARHLDLCAGIRAVRLQEYMNTLSAVVHQMTSKCVKNMSDTLPHFFSNSISTSSMIYHWTDARQHGVYLLTWQQALLRGRTNGAFPQVSKTEKDAIWHMILTYSLRLSCPRQRVKISFRTVNIQYVILWGDLFDKIGWRVGKTWVLMWAYSI